MCVRAMAIPVSDRRPCRANLGRGGLELITDVAWDFGRCPSGKRCEGLSSQGESVSGSVTGWPGAHVATSAHPRHVPGRRWAGGQQSWVGGGWGESPGWGTDDAQTRSELAQPQRTPFFSTFLLSLSSRGTACGLDVRSFFDRNWSHQLPSPSRGWRRRPGPRGGACYEPGGWASGSGGGRHSVAVALSAPELTGFP